MEKRWKCLVSDTEMVDNLTDGLEVPNYIAQILANRGLDTIDAAQQFLSQGKIDTISPFLMKGMDVAVPRIKRAIEQGEQIVVYGDYDVDGITATSVMMRVLGDLGAKVSYFIPNRHTDGYGLNCESLAELVETRGANLIISVDCGITSVEEADSLDENVDLIITDHHQPPATLPNAYAIINPKQEGCDYPEKMLAGVGVAFKVCQALWQTMRQEVLDKYLDLVALGTVADIVPLVGENRTFVQHGLAAMRTQSNVGIRALMKASQIEPTMISSGQIGFRLAPRLNAAGRLDCAQKGVEILLCNDEAECDRMAQELSAENEERQQIEKDILAEAIQTIEDNHLMDNHIIVVHGEGWHGGVIGIVASRIVEKYYRPTIVITVEDGVGKGSCRSIDGINMYEALSSAEDLLVRFGGHKQAAGLTIEACNLDAFAVRLNQYGEKYAKEDIWRPLIKIDATLEAKQIDEQMIDSLAVLEPFGMGNPRPVFLCERMQIRTIQRIGREKQTVKMRLECQGVQLDAIAWRSPELTDTYQVGDFVNVTFQPDINEWNGMKSVQLVLSDVRRYYATGSYMRTLITERLKDKENLSSDEVFFANMYQADIVTQDTAEPKRKASRKPRTRKKAGNKMSKMLEEESLFAGFGSEWIDE